MSGVRIFTGSSAVKWFMMNMEGVINLQAAQVNTVTHVHSQIFTVLCNWIFRGLLATELPAEDGILATIVHSQTDCSTAIIIANSTQYENEQER